MRKFFWIDLETTGLDPKTCSILEVACIVTDDSMRPLAEYETIVNPGTYTFESSALGMHKKSGLIDKIASGKNTKQVEDELYKFITTHEPRKNRGYIAGSSVHFDARFLSEHMPIVMNHLCHRYLDVSALGLGFCAKFGVDKATYKKERSHRAISDIKASIEEYKFYMDNFVKEAYEV